MSGMKEKMHTGELYLPGDESILKEQFVCLERLYDFNMTRPGEQEKRQKMLKEMFAEIGEGCYIEPPLHANFGGRHVHFGKNIYANFNLTLVDDTHIYVGDQTMFGPNVTVATAGASDPALPAREGIPVQRLCPHWKKLLDRRRRGHRSRRNHRGKRSDRRGKRGHERYPVKCRCCRKSLPRAPGNKRTRQRILF